MREKTNNADSQISIIQDKELSLLANIQCPISAKHNNNHQRNSKFKNLQQQNQI